MNSFIYLSTISPPVPFVYINNYRNHLFFLMAKTKWCFTATNWQGVGITNKKRSYSLKLETSAFPGGVELQGIHRPSF